MKTSRTHPSIPRLGILDFNPIQYHTPLYQLLARRGNINLDVLFLSNYGHRRAIDPEFGVELAWNIDLLSGYSSNFMSSADKPRLTLNNIRTLIRWIAENDVITIHGYSNPWMLLAIAACRSRGIPYLLRGDSAPQGQSSGWRRHLRNLIARRVVSASAGGLAIGKLNDAFYRNCGAPYVYFAPYSVDDRRFAEKPPVNRIDLLAHWGLSSINPVIMFCGKIYPGKRPLDLVEAVRLLKEDVTTIFVGDGVQADQIRNLLVPGTGVTTGFINQAELPSYYHAADILVLPSEVEKWGLVINEAMAAGAVPVVSDRVGAGPDLVSDVGEIFPCGDIPGLAAALSRALSACKDPCTRGKITKHASRYSLERTADGFEAATLAAYGRLQNHRSLDAANLA